MHLYQVNKGILPLLFILGLFKITGLKAAENQKGKQDFSGDYDDDISIEPEVAGSTETSKDHPFFELPEKTVYVSREGDNITIKCQPSRFNESKHVILWYRNEHIITNGNATLETGDFMLDPKHNLIIFNYTKASTDQYACAAEPGHDRQNMTIVFSPPDNISQPNATGASAMNFASFFQVAAMTLGLLMTANAWN